jgi:hypothetical protein
VVGGAGESGGQRAAAKQRGNLAYINANRVSNSLHLVRLRSRVEKLTMTVFLRSPLRHGLR